MTIQSADLDRFISISLATICPSRAADFPLFIWDNPEEPLRLYREANVPFDSEELHQLADRGVKRLYVTLNDHERYQHYLRENFSAILSDESLPVRRRFGCLNEIVRDVLAEVFAGRNTAKTVEASQQLAIQTVELICQGELLAEDLTKVLHHDYHTFTHSANVAYYSVLLAKTSGVTDRNELQQIATGALLHDVGKLGISESILTKHGQLDEDEWEVINQHPAAGLRMLERRNDLDFAQLMMVYQHHERMDGSGYPVGVSADRIHPWAQLCAVVDVYEALTSHRPYRPGLSREDTVAILDRQAGERLNKEYWECWKTIIQNA